MTIRTGWSATTSAETVSPAATPQPPDAEAWRTELAALEQRLQSQLRATPPAPAAAATGRSGGDAAVLRRVESLIAESERRQQRELALRIAGVMRDVDAQRQADLVRIDRTIGAVERTTGAAVMQQGQWLNYLVRTAQTR